MLRRFLFVMLAGGLALGVSACNEYRPTAANGTTSGVTGATATVAMPTDIGDPLYPAVQPKPRPVAPTFTADPIILRNCQVTLPETRKHTRPLRAMRGQPPGLNQRPVGCVFGPRCEAFQPGLCDAGQLPLYDVGDAPVVHHVRCARWQDIETVDTTSEASPPAPMERPKEIPLRCWVQPATPQPAAPVTATSTVTVADAQPQITNISASTSTLACAADTNGTHTANLTATATAGACGGNLTYKWTVSEGSLTNDTTPNATFDASTLNFEGGAQNQTKTVTATLTVTTETGKTATQTTQITVNCPPQFVRLSDVVFAKNKTRVNNCGKRVLIDEAAPRVANGDYDIILVGHRDNDETENAATTGGRRGRGRRARRGAEALSLDEQRALNAAAVLSGGTGTCGKVDPSRIKIDWVGADQTSDPQPGLCGTSNLPSQKERKGQEATQADKNRRVEVYLVPHASSTNPPAVKNARPLPADQMKALGCPK